MLASAIGVGSNAPWDVVVNERTTVATGNAFAQFVQGRRIKGNTYGMINAVHMATNLADPKTGAVGTVLAATPNETETSTLATLNSLTNVVAGCVADAHKLHRTVQSGYAARRIDPNQPTSGAREHGEISVVSRYPSDTEDPLFVLSEVYPVPACANTKADQLAAFPQDYRRFLQHPGQRKPHEWAGQFRDRREGLRVGE